MTPLISALLGVPVGMILGLTGAGGGIIAVPVLVAGLGWQMQQAMPVALLAVTGGAAVGALEGLRKKLVRYRAAIVMALAGMPFTAVGVSVAQVLPQQVLLVAFAAVLVLVSVRLMRRSNGNGAEPNPIARCRIDAQTGRFVWTWVSGLTIAAIGCAAGFATGLLGVGGGFIVVPMLRRYTNVSMHGAVATSLLVIALVGLAGVGSAIWRGVSVPLAFAACFAAATAAGMLAGRLLVRRLSPDAVQRGFALLLLAVAASLLWKAY